MASKLKVRSMKSKFLQFQNSHPFEQESAFFSGAMSYSPLIIFSFGTQIKDIKWFELHAGKHLWFKLKRK